MSRSYNVEWIFLAPSSSLTSHVTLITSLDSLQLLQVQDGFRRETNHGTKRLVFLLTHRRPVGLVYFLFSPSAPCGRSTATTHKGRESTFTRSHSVNYETPCQTRTNIFAPSGQNQNATLCVPSLWPKPKRIFFSFFTHCSPFYFPDRYYNT